MVTTSPQNFGCLPKFLNTGGNTLKLPDADNVRYHAGNGLVYVGHADAAITAFDAKTYAVKATVKLPGPPEAFQIDAGRKRLYVNCLKPATVAVLDLDTHEVVSKHPLKLADACYPMALDVKGQRVFVRGESKSLNSPVERFRSWLMVPVPISPSLYSLPTFSTFITVLLMGF